MAYGTHTRGYFLLKFDANVLDDLGVNYIMVETFELIRGGLIVLLGPQNLVILLVGVVIGLIAGSIPGLSASNTTAMLLPMTLVFPMDTALIFIAAVYMACQYGGSISAILINTPGASGAIATTLDGFPLCKQGKAGYALGLSLGASTFGGLVSSIIVLLIMKPISAYAMKINIPDLFLLALLGISIIISISGKKPAKGALAGVIGLLMAAMSAEPTYGRVRFTLGFFELYDGIPLISAMCGFFAFSSMIVLIGQKFVSTVEDTEIQVGLKSILFGVRKSLMYPINLIRSTLIGLVVGIIPGAGVDAAALLSYSQAQAWSKHPKTFGSGEPEGIVAPESANNAVAAGALVPAITIGIPGSSTTAIMLAALSLHGINPGPKVIQNFPNQVYALFISVLFATVLMFILGLLYTAMASRIAKVNMAYLIPGVLAICVAGSFATRGFMFDVYVFIAFGMIGYVMGSNGYPYAPMMLGIVMGKLAETNFSISIRLSSGSLLIFFRSVVSLCIWAILIIALVVPPLLRRWQKQKK
jgi:putative tricarboxylic transport membrane protein